MKNYYDTVDIIIFNTIYTINKNNDVIYYSNINNSISDKKTIPNISAIDISATRFGIVYIVDKDHKLFILNPTINQTPREMINNVMLVTPGILSVPIYIDVNNNVFVPKFIIGQLE